MKKSLLVVLILLLILCNFVFSKEYPEVSTKVLKDAKKNNKVDVIIKFNDPYIFNTRYYQGLDSSGKLEMKKEFLNDEREIFLKTLDDAGIKIKNKFNYSNTISATISEEMLDKLKQSDYVEWIHEEISLSTFLDDSSQIIGANSFWQTIIENLPINGTGETACIIDSGVDYRHDALGNCSIVNNVLYGNNLSYSLSSSHPYTDNLNTVYKINQTGFEKIALHFTNITLEPEWDFIKILDPNTDNSTIAVYTGYHDNIWTPGVEGDTIYVMLETDNSVTEWGFEIDLILNGTHNSTINWTSCEKVVDGWDFSGITTTMDDQDPLDDYSHGTHVAGIVSSIDPTYRGIAPGSKIVAMKAMNSAGKGNVTDVIASIEYCIENKEKYNISVITLSLGSASVYSSNCDAESGPFTWFSEIVDEAINSGIMVIAAAGNDNAAGIAFPACLENVTSVGASTKSDIIDESYSNTASTLDLVAPGTGIWSAKYGTDEFYSKDGTSMAVPHVAGAALLLRNFKRLENGTVLQPLEIENILKITGDNLTDSRNSLKFPRINLTKALAYIDDDPRFSYISGNTTGNISVKDIFFNISLSEPCSIAKIELDNLNYSMNGSSKNYYYNLSDLSSGLHNYTLHIIDYTGNLVSSGLQVFEVDSTAPFWVNISFTPNNSYYSAEKIYQFNVTWNDSNIEYVWIEHNFSHQLENYSVTNLTNIYIYNFSGLAAGNYKWRMHAQDSISNINSTQWDYYTVAKSDPGLMLQINNSQKNITWERGYNALVNGSSFQNQSDIYLYINNILYNESRALLENISFMKIDIYNITLVHEESQNYTYSQKTYTINVTDTKQPLITITSPLNNSMINKSYNLNLSFTTNENSTCLLYYNTSILISGTRDFEQHFSVFENKFTNLTINCTDLSNRTTSSILFFTVNDTAYPEILTAEETSSADSATISLTADELVNYSATLNSEDKYSSDYTLSKIISFSGLLSGTEYVYNIYVCDRLKNCYTYTDSITTEESTQTNSGGGGGGSTSSVGIEEDIEDMSDQRFFYNPQKGVHSFEITKNILVTQIDLEIKKSMSNSVLLKIEQIDTISLKKEPQGNVHKYFSVEKDFIEDSNIEKAEIYFKVEKEWADDYDYIILERYIDDWLELKTEQVDKDSDFYYYKTETPGFSYFAVVGKNNNILEEEQVESQDIEQLNKTHINNSETYEEAPLSQHQPRKSLLSLFLILFVCLTITLFVYYISIRSSKDTKK